MTRLSAPSVPCDKSGRNGPKHPEKQAYHKRIFFMVRGESAGIPARGAFLTCPQGSLFGAKGGSG